MAAPNVLYIVLDDVGFAAMSCYGGPIETPNIDRIAAQGVRYTQWHTTALCSPTRSCLLTGRNHTRNSMACITEAAIGFPNASGTIPPENGMLSEILGELGWNTYMVGKWHLCPTDEMNLAATRRNWPTGRGFERWYGFLGAETNQWYPDLVYDNHPVDPPRSPEEGYHLTEDITDKALEFIKDAKVDRAGEAVLPLLRARRLPRAAPRAEGVDRAGSRASSTWATRRSARQTLARQKEMGLVPADTELPQLNPIGTPETRTGPDGKPFPALDYTRPWDSLNDEEKRLFSRMAEVYAGFLGHADEQISASSTTSRRPSCSDTRWSVLVSGDVAERQKNDPTAVSTRMKFADGVPMTLAKRTSRGSTTSVARVPQTAARPGGRWRSTRRSGCGRTLPVQQRQQRALHHRLAGGDGRRADEDTEHETPRHRDHADDFFDMLERRRAQKR